MFYEPFDVDHGPNLGTFQSSFFRLYHSLKFFPYFEAIIGSTENSLASTFNGYLDQSRCLWIETKQCRPKLRANNMLTLIFKLNTCILTGFFK